MKARGLLHHTPPEESFGERFSPYLQSVNTRHYLISLFLERLQKRLSQNYHVHDLQITANDVRKAERLVFLPEMQSKVISSSGTEYKLWGFGLVHFLK